MSEKNTSGMSLQIQRIYTKDVSFETPHVPQIFQKELEPEVKLDLGTESNQIDKSVYEVTISLTVKAFSGTDIAFLCEVKQAGIFTITDVDEIQMSHFLCVYCPNILFPYARECISNLVSRGTFPQLNLAPIDFNSLFMTFLKKKEKQ